MPMSKNDNNDVSKDSPIVLVPIYSWSGRDKEIVFNFNSDTRCCSFV